MFFLELKLNTKEGTANERTHLHIFIKFIKKNKKNSEIADEKKWLKQAIEENKQKVTIKRLVWEFNLYWKFMCADKNNDKS